MKKFQQDRRQHLGNAIADLLLALKAAEQLEGFGSGDAAICTLLREALERLRDARDSIDGGS